MSDVRESWHKLVDNIIDLAEEKGMHVNRMPLQLTQMRIKGKGKKAVLVAEYSLVLDPSSFVGGEDHAISALLSGMDFGVILAIPKDKIRA